MAMNQATDKRATMDLTPDKQRITVSDKIRQHFQYVLRGIDEESVAVFRREHLHLPASLGDRLADAVAAGMGSWRFIIIQTTVVVFWMSLNTVALISHWDPYPFILLNLLFSTQAAYASPIILMSANRAAAIDRKRDDHEATEVTALYEMNQIQLETLDTQTKTLNVVQSINEQQLEILTLLHKLLDKSNL